MSAEFFASADLNDDNELAPLQFTLDTQIGPGPYASVMQNILSRHCHEIRNSAETSVYSSIHQISRKKLKELLELGAITQEEFDEKKSVLLKDI